MYFLSFLPLLIATTLVEAAPQGIKNAELNTTPNPKYLTSYLTSYPHKEQVPSNTDSGIILIVILRNSDKSAQVGYEEESSNILKTLLGNSQKFFKPKEHMNGEQLEDLLSDFGTVKIIKSHEDMKDIMPVKGSKAME